MRKQDKGAVLAIAASMPTLAYRLFFSYLRVKVRAKKASKEFYRSLIANGLPKREAKALRDEYGSGMSLTSLIRSSSRRSR